MNNFTYTLSPSNVLLVLFQLYLGHLDKTQCRLKTMKTRKDSSTLNAQRYESSVEEKLLIEDNNKCRFIRLTSIEQPEAPVYSPP